MTITASDGPLPDDTVVRVAYGGGIEKYDLASPPKQPEVIFCTQLAADAGAADASGDDAGNDAGTSPVSALSCDLWTNAAATVSIQATGYPDFQQQLEAEKDDCGIKTVDYQLLLDKGDSGQ